MKTCILVLLTVALFGFCGFVVWKINDFIYDHRDVTDTNDIMEPEEIVLNENVSEEEMIAEIKQNIADGDYAQAFATIKKELSMPYIPEDTEEQLYTLLKDLRFQMSEKRNTERSVDDILDGLRGGSECQLVSAAQLAKRNLNMLLRVKCTVYMPNP